MRHAYAATIAVATLLLAGCSSGTDDSPTSVTPTMPTAPAKVYPATPAGCHDALKAQYAPGTITLTGQPTEPPACQGLSTDEVSSIAEKVISEQLGN